MLDDLARDIDGQHRTHPFGDLVTRFRARKHGLSQAKVAEMGGLETSVLSHMCNGRRLDGNGARGRVRQVLRGLQVAGALATVEAANSLLRAAKMADLDADDRDDAHLLALLTISESKATGDGDGVAAASVKRAAVRSVGGSGGGRDKWTEAQRFTVGAPIIYPESFFGRTRELTKLFGLLRGPQLQNGAVIGARYMGKTSLLRYVASIPHADPRSLRHGQKQNWLPHSDKYVWVYVDLRDSRLHTPKLLLSYILQQFGLPQQKKVTLELFGQMVREELPLPAVILLDNIDVAVQHYAKLDYGFWVGLSSVAHNDAEGKLGFVVASQESFGQMARHPVVGSSFFTSIATSIELGPLAESEALELIDASPIPFPLRDVSWMLQYSNLEPMPLQ
ncbi:MAG: hypothetical protein ABIQ44_00075, partial [Chloroflexia bacterium]